MTPRAFLLRSVPWLLLAAAPLAAQEPTAALAAPAGVRLTLDEALARAEGASEAVGIARAGARRARGDERATRSGYLPQLSGSASYTRTLATQFSGFAAEGADSAAGPVGPCNGFRPDPTLPDAQRLAELERAVDCSVNGSPFGGANIPFGQRNTWNFGLALTQTLFDARLNANARAAAATRRSAEIGIDVERAQMVLDVASAYYDAALADRLLQIAESTLAQTERTLRDVTLAKEVGTQPEFDRLRAQVARDNQRPAVIQRRTQRDLAYVRLRQLLDLPQGTALQLATALEEADVEGMPLPSLVAALAGDADTLGGARAVVRQSTEQLAAREAQLAAAGAERLPVLSAGSDYARIGFGNEFFPAFRDFVDDWTVNVRLRVPLFTGGRISGQRLAARANRDDAALRLKQAEERAERDALTVAATREAAVATWSASAGTVAQAQRAYEIAELRFREGLSTQTELADARIQLEQARATRAQAARDLLVARLRESLLPYLPLGTADAVAGGASASVAQAGPTAPSQ